MEGWEHRGGVGGLALSQSQKVDFIEIVLKIIIIIIQILKLIIIHIIIMITVIMMQMIAVVMTVSWRLRNFLLEHSQ